MRDRIRFILDGQVREIDGVDPTLTVLQYLRGDLRRCGTKEGCGEGDCGACTVVLVDLHRGALRYRAVNACILFVPALDGKALLTVESACRPGGALHPVQQAIVECHASQCGFCTPGFVMSLLALYETEAAPSRARIEEVLAGNLCRCTGYRPLVAAAERACADRGAVAEREASLAALLRGIAPEGGLSLEHAGRRFLAPATLAALDAALAANPGAQLVAGGTDVGVSVTKGRRTYGTVISLAGVAELGRLEESPTHLEIGGAVTYAEAQPLLERRFPELAQLVRRIGSQQIRNVGTLAGNLGNASPVGDMLPALVALGATILLRHAGSNRELPVEDLFLGYRRTALRPGEVIERVRLPLGRAERTLRVYKVSKRREQDISAVVAGFSLALAGGRVADVRLCYGGMAATPRRATGCERALLGQPWTEAAVAAALPALDADFAPISDARASAAYRRLVARNLLRKFHLETSAPPGADRARAAGEVA